MEIQEILRHVDHTLLSQTATWEEIKTLCDDAIAYGTASVCIPPSYVKQAKAYVKERMTVCTVIGFPNGYNTTAAKVFETAEAVKDGADEVDMVINMGWVKDREYGRITQEIRSVKEAAGSRILKVWVTGTAIYAWTASVCVKQAKAYVKERHGRCTVIGFPNGYNTTAAKVFETAEAVMRWIWSLSGVRPDHAGDPIRQKAAGSRILKVIIETCFLEEEEKIRMCQAVTEAGADFIKTSTGFGSGGATFEDVALFARHVGEGVQIKAAGGSVPLRMPRNF